jgi:hypothetical protein
MNKQKQALFILIFAIFSWADVSAQLITEDVVYLKNGSIIRGKIIKNENDTLKIESFGYNIFVFKSDEIQKIEQEQKKLSKQVLRSTIVPENTGFYSYSTLGMLIGKSESNDAQTFSFQTIAGYSINRFIGIGAGVGIEKLQTEIIPVFLSFKSNLLERTNSPFLLFNIGYSYPLSKEKNVDENYSNYTYKYSGGMNVGFDIGILSHKIPNRAFTITAGYRYQLVKETNKNNYWYQNSVEKNTYEFNRIAVKIGFMFM